MLKMQHPHDPRWHGRLHVLPQPTLAWSCGQNTCAWFSAKSSPEELLPRTSSNLTLSERNSVHIPQGPPAEWTTQDVLQKQLLNWTNTVTETHLKPNQRNPGTNHGIHTAETKAGHTSHSRPEQHCFPPLLDWSKCFAATSMTGETVFTV